MHEVFSLLRVSRHIYTIGTPEELSVYAHTMARPGQAQAQTPPNLLRLCSKALVCFFIAEGILWRVLKNRIERAF